MSIKAFFNPGDVDAVKAARDFCRSRHMRGFPELDTLAARLAEHAAKLNETVEALPRYDMMAWPDCDGEDHGARVDVEVCSYGEWLRRSDVLALLDDLRSDSDAKSKLNVRADSPREEE